MKSFKLIVVAALVAAASLPAMAQFSNSKGNQATADIPASYDRLTVGYNAYMWSGDQSGAYLIDGKDDDGMTSNGIAVQYTHGFSISQSAPVYLELGVKGVMNFHSESKSEGNTEVKVTAKALSLSVPVNIAYRIKAGETCSIIPYTGLHLTGNLMGKGKYTAEYGSSKNEEKIDMFDKDDVGKDGQWKRVQFGWQIGAGAEFGKYYIGLEYGLEFNELYKKCKTSNFTASVGLYF